MKTKNLLFIILLIGLSFNAFSQEEVTIKQVIKNSSTNPISIGDDITLIRINTSLPVTIKEGGQNAIYLTGEFNSPEDYAGFCMLENGVLMVNSPKKGKSIKIELASDVQLFHFNNNASVLIYKDIIIRNQGEFLVENNSKAVFYGYITGNELKVVTKNNSKINSFATYLNKLDLKIEKYSEVELNGKVNIFKLTKDDDSKLIKDKFLFSSLLEPFVSPEGDTIFSQRNNIKLKRDPLKIDKSGNLISSKGDTIEKASKEDASSLVLKELSDAFAEASENLKNEEPNEVTKPIADAFKTVADNLDKEDIQKEAYKEKKKKSKEDIGFQFGYGILGWSNRVSNIDNLFYSPKGQYTLAYSDSWSLGFRYEYEINRRWTISTGIGYESNIFRFENNVKLTDINGEKRIGFETDAKIDAESKLVARYVTIPLFVKFRVVNNFNVHIGAIAGINFRTSSTGFKRDYNISNAEVEERWGTKYDNFKPVKLDIQAGFGWRITNFYLKYSLTPLFKDNKETEVYPFSVGVSFGL